MPAKYRVGIIASGRIQQHAQTPEHLPVALLMKIFRGEKLDFVHQNTIGQEADIS